MTPEPSEEFAPPPEQAEQPPPPQIPDQELYQPLFSPWNSALFSGRIAECAQWTLVSPDRLWVLYSLAQQAIGLGEFWECGVYRGGSALLLARLIANSRSPNTRLRLFDTFSGMPETDPERDLHGEGDFGDTSAEAVAERVGHPWITSLHAGFIPDTFAGHESAQIGFGHIDTDIYRSVFDCCEFMFPRLVRGGFLVFDDYGFPSCPGARQAVDDYFANHKGVVPLVLPTGQAVVFKGVD